MKQFMILIREESTDFSKFSPKDFAEFMQQYEAWSRKMAESGQNAGGAKLNRDLGRTLRKKGSQIVVDGPYAEAKDAVGGFYIINANDMEEAIEIAKGCPSLSHGGAVEVRLVDVYRK